MIESTYHAEKEQEEHERQRKLAVKEETKIKNTSQKASNDHVIDGTTGTTTDSISAPNSATESEEYPCNTSTTPKDESGGDFTNVSKASISGPTSSRTTNPIAALTSMTGSENSSGSTPEPSKDEVAGSFAPAYGTAEWSKQDFIDQFQAAFDCKKSARVPLFSTESSGDVYIKTSMPLGTGTTINPSATPSTKDKGKEDFIKGFQGCYNSKWNTEALSTSTRSPADNSNETSEPLDASVTKVTTDNPIKASKPPVPSGNPFAWADSTPWRNLATNPTSQAASVSLFDSNRPKPKCGNQRHEVEELSSISDVESEVSTADQVNRGAPAASTTTGNAQMGISQWAPAHHKVHRPQKNAALEATNKKK